MKLIPIGAGTAFIGILFALGTKWINIDIGIWRPLIALGIAFIGIVVMHIGIFKLKPPKFRP